MLIVENDKDKRSLAWLQSQFAAAEIDAAVAAIEQRGQKAYLSMLAKQLKTRVPADVWHMQSDEKSAIRAKLKALRDEIAAKSAHV